MPEEVLFYAETCPLCRQGVAGFRRCGSASHILLVCDECYLTWATPADVLSGEPLPMEDDGYPICPHCKSSLWGENSAWATMEEISCAGWVDCVQGETPPAGYAYLQSWKKRKKRE